MLDNWGNNVIFVCNVINLCLDFQITGIDSWPIGEMHPNIKDSFSQLPRLQL